MGCTVLNNLFFKDIHRCSLDGFIPGYLRREFSFVGSHLLTKQRKLSNLKSCSIGINRFRLVEFFRVLLAKKKKKKKKTVSVGLVAQLFQPASNWAKTVEKETTENGWKSILSGKRQPL